MQVCRGVEPMAHDGTQLLMYHDQLPPMQRITLGGTEQDGGVQGGGTDGTWHR